VEATIKRADNGYVVTLRFSSALAEQTHVFKDLQGAFEKIDGFFLEGLLAEVPDPGAVIEAWTEED